MPGSALFSVHIRRIVVVLLVAAGIVPALGGTAHAATSSALTRYPYLTDSIQTSITINWATDTSGTTASVEWGPTGSCLANTQAATKTSITVISKAEYQWKATIPVTSDTTYCYRVFLGSIDLLGSDPSPTFISQVAPGSSAPFSFDVFGDWGQAYANGNPDQTNVLNQMSLSGARFAVMTGDTAYPGGGQKEYGDLQQAGADISTVFGPTFWTVPGRSLPVFNVTGNHGFTNGAIQVVNWPEGNAAANSGGKYLMEPYPSMNGTTAKNYPSMWYAWDAGPARFYALTAAWSDSNIGSATPYQNDRDQHWMVNRAEYQWLKADLEAHPNALKFAFWHYPLYADSRSQPSDTFLQGGSGTLQGLLDQNHVAIVFNGHAHGYERNTPDSAGMVSYVLGNGGAAMGSVSGCSSFDAYAIGANGSHCGAAPAGLSLDHVFGFAKVTVNGRQVTVTPTDEMGRTFDVQTYSFGSGPNDFSMTASPSTVSVTAGQSGTSTINTAVTSGSAESVTLSASGQPSGVTVGINPTSVTAGGSSIMTITVPSSTAPGNYPITVTGTAASATHTVSITLAVTATAQNDFSIAASPTSVSLTAGQSGTSTISTTVTSGSAESVTLSASGEPSGVTVGFNPSSVTAGGSSTMTITVPSSTAPGNYPITVTGTAASATHTVSVTLAVTAPAQNDFSIAASPTSVSVTAGQSGTSRIDTAVTSGSAESVTLSASGEPSGVAVGFNPGSVIAGGSSTMTITVPSSTAPGNYPITVTGTAPSATHTLAVTLTVVAAGSSPQLVQTAAGTETSAATSLAATFANSTTAGHLLVLSASVYTGVTNRLTSVTDSAGNTWTRIGSYAVSGHNSDGELWYTAGAAPATTVTVHTASAASVVFQVQEFAGIATTNPLDTSVGASNTGVTPSSGFITPTGTHDLVVGFLAGHGNSQTMTVTTAGYTVQPQQTTTGTVVTVRTGYQVLSSASPIDMSGSFPTAMYWAAGVAAFRAAS